MYVQHLFFFSVLSMNCYKIFNMRFIPIFFHHRMPNRIRLDKARIFFYYLNIYRNEGNHSPHLLTNEAKRKSNGML